MSSRYGYDRNHAYALLMRAVYLVPLVVFYLLLHICRRMQRWYLSSRAASWPTTDATIHSSYELDENQSIVSSQGWDMDDYDEEDNEYEPRLAVALQYSYQAEGELYSGTYFLPGTYSDGELSSADTRAWIAKKIIVRYNPTNVAQSAFLVQDGAPGQPHIPKMLSYSPDMTSLSLQ